MRPHLASLAVCAVALAPAAGAAETGEPAPFHVALSSGIGFAYDGVGVRLDLRWRRAAVFFSSGPFGLAHTSTNFVGTHESPALGSFAAGVRWYFHEEGAELFSNAYAMRSESRVTGPYVGDRRLERSVHAAITIGSRWRWGGFFLEASVGPVFHYDKQYLADEPGAAGETVAYNVGLLYDTGRSGSGWAFLPTVDLGFGFEF